MTTTTRLLIVDDHPLMRDGIVAHLQEEPGVEVIGQAGNGREALEQARLLKPDMVLMDLSMPVMDGPEAIRHFRAEMPNIRILILSMHDEPGRITEGIQAGAAGYVRKDAGAAEVMRAIAAVRGGGHYFGAGISIFPSASDPLTERETEVLKLVAQGRSSKEIARILGGLSDRTIDTHRASIRAKLDIATTAGLTQYAIQHGLI